MAAMLDKKYILENVDAVKQNIKKRQVTVELDTFIELENKRRELQQQVDAVRAESNSLAKNKDLSIEEKRGKGQALKQHIQALEAEIAPIKAAADDIYMQIPNLTAPESPVGDEDKGETLEMGATALPEFEFEPKDHVALMENLGMLNLEAGAKVSGSGFYYLTNMGALLEMALNRYALDVVMKKGYSPTLTPDIARNSIMVGAGFVPRGNESNTFELEGHDASLIATSEITLIGMFQNETLDTAKLPVKLAGQSHCFRSERAHGALTRGIYRVHQFSKTEMVVVCTAEQAEEIHFEMRAIEQEIFDSLEIPYRVIEIATGDLGAPAYRKFDLEAWMPGRKIGDTVGSFGEITSTSNCLEFQARRLNIKHKTGADKAMFASTLNGTAVSTARALIALVENHQNADGSVNIPAVLQPYVNGETVIKPA